MNYDIPTRPLLDSAGLPALAGAELRSIDRVIALFRLGMLPPHLWTHRVCLAVGLHYVLQYGFDEGLRRVRQRLRDYYRGIGRADDYNESDTVYRLWVIAEFRRRNPLVRHRIVLYRRLLEDAIAEPKFVERAYSPERLASAEARRRFVAPDRKRLPRRVVQRLRRVSERHAAFATTIPGTLAVSAARPC